MVENPDERELWEQFRELPDGRSEAGACPQAQEIGAYAENRLTGTALEATETHLTACAACRNAVRIAQEVLAQTAEPEGRANVTVTSVSTWRMWPLRAAAIVLVASMLVLAYTAGSRVATAVVGASTNSIIDDTLGSDL